MTDIFAQLAAPFPPERISWRVGSTNADKTRGMALAYIDARDVMERLDEACTPLGWQCEYVPMPNATTCCRIGIAREDGTWVWKSNGAGATDYEAEKGAYSDAFKRAAVLFGIGRYLYDLDSPWVAVEAKGRSVLIKDEEKPRLEALLRGEKPKSARQGHKDGDFKRLEGLFRGVKTLRALETLWKNEQPAITALPDGWRTAIIEEKDRAKERLTEKVDV